MKAGYKQTEVGVIPADWEVRELGDILKVKHGKDQKLVQSVNGLYPILGTGGLMGFSREFLYNSESVLIGRKGTINKPQFMTTPFWTVDTLFYTEIKKLYFPKFIFYKFNLIDWYSYNEASGVPSLNARTIEKINVSIPPTKTEQTAIAKALSDTDALIQSLSQLIAKKRQIKQGAMQSLLNPYDETGVLKTGWVVKILGQVADFENGKAHEQHIDSMGEFIVVNSKFISTQGNIYKTSKQCISPLNKGDITMVMSDIPNGKALARCFTIPISNKYTLNQRICSIRSELLDNNFIGLILNRNTYFLGFDSGTGQTNLKKIDVLNCPITYPENKSEQTQIAKILADMDTEITTLETKLSKYQKIKQGMMQNLLTGRIRLVTPSLQTAKDKTS